MYGLNPFTTNQQERQQLMSTLKEPRNTREIICGCAGFNRKLEIAENAVIFPGAIVAIDSLGKAVEASDSEGIVVAGICEAVFNGHAYVRSGAFRLENGTAEEALTVNDIGKTVYIVNDQTVGKIGGEHHIVAGMLRDVDGNEVIVEIGNLPVTVPVALTVSEDPEPATTSLPGKLLIIAKAWTGGEAIAEAAAGEIYMNNGLSWVKLA